MLLGALGAAALIAMTLVVVLGLSGGDDGTVAANDGNATPASLAEPPQRVKLLVTFGGDGKGEIKIAPSGSVCDTSCERRYDTDTRVTVTAKAAIGSTFKGWGESCDGTGSCSITLDEQRKLTATFQGEPVDPVAPPPAISDENLGAAADELEEELDEGLDPVASGDCADNRDNDGDGLTDTEQDPDCAEGNAEGGAAAPPPPPSSTRATDDCSDGRDNDGDGLTDTAQDPDCVAGKTESGTTRSTKKRARSECRDGRDNDGDGLIDRAQDPGCIEDGSET